MAGTRFKKELLEELAELIDLGREFRETRRVPVIYDGSQFTIKIPKKIALKAGLKVGSIFEFRIKSRFNREKRMTELAGKLIK